MSKQYNLSTTDDNGQSVTTSQTVTEHPEEILRLMKLAGLENAQVVAEDESVYEPTPANDKLELTDFEKKTGDGINKQKKSIQPTLGDNPLEYSLDENEIYEAMMEEFDKTEEVTDGTREELTRLIQPGEYLNFPSNPSAADFLGDMKIILKQIFSSQGTKVPEEITDLYNKLLAYHKDEELQAKNRKIPSEKSNHAPYYPENMDEEYVASFADPFYDAFRSTADALGIDDLEEAKEEVTEAQSPKQKAAFAKMLAAKKGKKDDTVEETTDELKEETISEDCGCGHGSDCDCGPECDCGCNAVNETTENNMSEEQARIRELAGIDSQSINEDESVWNQFLKLNDEMDFESEDRIFFSLKHWPKHRFELHGDIDGKDTKSGGVHLGVLVSREDGDDDNFAGNMSMPQDEIKANITGAGWVGTNSDIKGTAGDYKEFSDVFPEPYDDKEPEDQHKNIHAFSKDASGEYHNKDEDASESVDVEEDGAAISGAIAKHKHNSRKRTYNDDGKAPKAGHHNTTSNRWAESTEEDATEDESLNESQKRLAKLIKY